MRTTLDLDDDLVKAAEAIAREQGTTVGQVISDIVRRSLHPKSSLKSRNGVPLLTPKPGSRRADLRIVNELRDEL